jgi:hypothetical protein
LKEKIKKGGENKMAELKIEVNPIWEACKEPLRLLVLALIPFAIAYLTELNYSWAVAATVVLRFIDKLLYEIGKANGNKSIEAGLTRF